LRQAHDSLNTLTSDLFSQPLEAIYAAAGNDAEQWVLHAYALLRAGDMLYSTIGEPPPGTAGPEAVWDWFGVHNIGRMLRGMALECLLKAAWLRSGGRLVERKRFVGIPGTQGHDLYRMYVEVCKKRPIALNLQEKRLLARFSYAIVMARYPVAKSFGGGYPSAPTSRNKMKWNAWSHHADTKVWCSLRDKILAAVLGADV
jgi:hypothetical protein